VPEPLRRTGAVIRKTPALPLLAGLGLGCRLCSLLDPLGVRNHAAGLSVAANGMPYLESLKGMLLMHPPSLAYVVGWSIRLFGDHVWAWRLPGLCLLLASGILIWSLGSGVRRRSFGRLALLGAILNQSAGIQVALGIDFADAPC